MIDYDAIGLSGACFQYGMTIAMMGSALFCFFYLWSHRRLDFDEDPKYQIFDECSSEEKHGPSQ